MGGEGSFVKWLHLLVLSLFIPLAPISPHILFGCPYFMELQFFFFFHNLRESEAEEIIPLFEVLPLTHLSLSSISWAWSFEGLGVFCQYKSHSLSLSLLMRSPIWTVSSLL